MERRKSTKKIYKRGQHKDAQGGMMQKRDIDKLFKGRIKPELWNTTEKYLEKKLKITDKSMFNEREGKNFAYINGILSDEYDEYRVNIVWTEKKSFFHGKEYEILTCRCSCKGYVNKDNPCEHLLAFLFKKKLELEIDDEEDNDKEENIFFKDSFEEEFSENVFLRFNAVPAILEGGEKTSFKFKDFYLSKTNVDFLKEIRLKELVTQEGAANFKMFYLGKKLTPDDNFKEFIDFFNEITKLGGNTYIDFLKNELVIPEIGLDKAVKFMRLCAENYKNDIIVPIESYISMSGSDYVVLFRNFSKVVPIGKKYLAAKGKTNENNIKVYEVGSQHLKKIKYLMEKHKDKKSFKVKGETTTFIELLTELEKIGRVFLDDSLRVQTLRPKKTKLCLYIDETYEEEIVIIPQFLYDGKPAEEYEKKCIVLRNVSEEREQLSEIKKILAVYGFKSKNNKFFLPENPEMNYKFMTKHIEYLKSSYKVVLSGAMKSKEYKKIVPEVKVSMKGTVRIDFSMPGMERDEFSNIFKKINNGEKYCRISDDSLVQIESAEMTELVETLNGLDVVEEELKQGIIIRTDIFIPFVKNTLKSIFGKQAEDEESTGPQPRRKRMSPHLKIMKQYEKRGANALIQLKLKGYGGILADEMGLEKCIQMIACLDTCPANDKYRMIIVPSYRIRYWEMEFKRCAPDYKVRLVSGYFDSRMRTIDRFKPEETIVTSYEAFMDDHEKYAYMKFDTIICDNPFVVKNRIKFLESIKNINRETCFCLAGGFLNRDFMGMHYLFELVRPGYLGNRELFESKYVKIKLSEKEKKIPVLESLIKPFIIRRRRKKVIDEIPSIKTENLLIDIYGKERDVYTGYLKKINIMTLFGDQHERISSKRMAVLVRRLIQVCSHPKMGKRNFSIECEKMKALSDIVRESIREKRRTVVVTQYDKMLDIFEEKFGLIYRCSYITPETDLQERKEICENFNKEERSLLFASRVEFKDMLDLNYDNIIYYDPSWKEIKEGAIKNGFLDRKVIEVNLLLKGTFEEKIFDKKPLFKNKIVSSIMNYDKEIPLDFTKSDMFDLMQL